MSNTNTATDPGQVLPSTYNSGDVVLSVERVDRSCKTQELGGGGVPDDTEVIITFQPSDYV